MFDKIIKGLRWVVLGCWGALLIGNIFLCAGGNPPEMSWANIFIHETAIVTMALAENIRNQ